MRWKCLAVLFAAGLAISSPAHFMWALYEHTTRSAKIEFGEAPGSELLPFEAQLAARFTPKPSVIKESGLSYSMETSPILSCAVQYGVVKRGAEPFLLTYQAKTVSFATAAGQATGQGLELVGVPSQEGWRVKALINGKLAIGAELFDKMGNPLHVDKAGFARIIVKDQEPTCLRASLRQEGRGAFEGKAYKFKKIWATIVLPPIGQVSEGSDWESYRALQFASDARESFTPGVAFTCRFEATDGVRKVTGTVSQSKEGDATIGFDHTDPRREHVKSQLESLFMHRHAVPFWQGEGRSRISSTTDVTDLGPRILLNDRFKSSYRIKNGVIRVVDRCFGPSHLILTINEIESLPSGRYLSKAYNSVMTDTSGNVESRLSYRDEFVKLGFEHMPKRRTVKGLVKGKRVSMTVAFTDYKFD